MVNVSARPVLPPELDPRGTRRGSRQRPPALRVVNVIAVALAAVVVLASVGGYVVVKWFDGSIARIHLNLGQGRPAGAGSGSQNWLLVGTDSRAGSDGEYGDAPGQRSDTTILTHLDKDGTTTNLSFPRDSLVTIPEYTDSSGTVHPARRDKFNSAISVGGASLLVRTVEAMTHIRIDHYVSVDLEGFKKISEAVGGVRVCILHSDYTDPGDAAITNINDGFSGFHGRDGVQTVVGDQALAYVRQRHGLANGDIGRIARQQQFLGSVFRKATTAGLLVNPVRVTRLISAIKDALTLDQNTNLTDLEKLGLRLRGVDPSKVSFETIPARGLEYSDTNLGSVVNYGNGAELVPTGQTNSVGNVQVIDQAGFEAMLAKLKDQAPPAPKPAQSASDTSDTSDTSKAPTTLVTVPAAEVVVTVKNGVGRTGLAAQVTKALASEGFQTGAPRSAGRSTSTSEVRYAPGSKNSAQTVAAAIPGSVLREDPSVGSGVVLILGANYTSVRPVHLSGEPAPTNAPSSVPSSSAPSPAPSASPAPPANTAASPGNTCGY